MFRVNTAFSLEEGYLKFVLFNALPDILTIKKVGALKLLEYSVIPLFTHFHVPRINRRVLFAN